MKYIASGEDFFTNDDPHCILIDADDFGEALGIYRKCFPDDLAINIDEVTNAVGYPDPTHNHVQQGVNHHAVLYNTTLHFTDADLDIETSSLNGFNIMFKGTMASLYPIRGCPMGRGITVDAAKADLKRRTEIESAVIITFTE